MFKVTSKIEFANGKPPVVEVWEGLEKTHVIADLEAGWIRVMAKMNAMSGQVAAGKLAKVAATNPTTMTWTTTVEQDGKLWTSAVLTWPGMSEEAQALFFGMKEGEAAHLSREVKSKRHGHK